MEIIIGKQIWSDLLDIDVPGSVKINGIRYYTYEQALQAAKIFQEIYGSEWRLPTKEDFIKLAKEVRYSPDKLIENGFVKGGICYNGSESLEGSYRYYWSSTWYNNTNAYCMYFDSSGVYPQNYRNKHNGFAVHCIKKLETDK